MEDRGGDRGESHCYTISWGCVAWQSLPQPWHKPRPKMMALCPPPQACASAIHFSLTPPEPAPSMAWSFILNTLTKPALPSGANNITWIGKKKKETRTHIRHEVLQVVQRLSDKWKTPLNSARCRLLFLWFPNCHWELAPLLSETSTAAAGFRQTDKQAINSQCSACLTACGQIVPTTYPSDGLRKNARASATYTLHTNVLLFQLSIMYTQTYLKSNDMSRHCWQH